MQKKGDSEKPILNRVGQNSKNMEFLKENPDMIWKEKISKNGKKYYIGYSKTAKKLGKLGDKKPFNQEVDWPVAGNDNWIVQDNAFIAKTGISRYTLYENPWYKFYKYRLKFTCQEHYDYYFTDETGDIYECNAYVNGDHNVQFDSDKPKIMHIKGD